MRNSTKISTLALLVLTFTMSACGGGLPITIIIDDFGEEIDLDEVATQLQTELFAAGVLPPSVVSLPELWPDSLPDLRYSTSVALDPIPIDLNPDDPAEADKFKEINNVKNALRRIEFNSLILRVDTNTGTVATPELTLQVATEPDADPDDRTVWFTVGVIPAREAGFVGDIPMEFAPGGGTFLSDQLGDEDKDFALRARGRLDLDTSLNRNMPRGKIALRMIVVATFFVEPEKLL